MLSYTLSISPDRNLRPNAAIVFGDNVTDLHTDLEENVPHVFRFFGEKMFASQKPRPSHPPDLFSTRSVEHKSSRSSTWCVPLPATHTSSVLVVVFGHRVDSDVLCARPRRDEISASHPPTLFYDAGRKPSRRRVGDAAGHELAMSGG